MSESSEINKRVRRQVNLSFKKEMWEKLNNIAEGEYKPLSSLLRTWIKGVLANIERNKSSK